MQQRIPIVVASVAAQRGVKVRLNAADAVAQAIVADGRRSLGMRIDAGVGPVGLGYGLGEGAAGAVINDAARNMLLL